MDSVFDNVDDVKAFIVTALNGDDNIERTEQPRSTCIWKTYKDGASSGFVPPFCSLGLVQWTTGDGDLRNVNHPVILHELLHSGGLKITVTKVLPFGYVSIHDDRLKTRVLAENRTDIYPGQWIDALKLVTPLNLIDAVKGNLVWESQQGRALKVGVPLPGETAVLEYKLNSTTREMDSKWISRQASENFPAMLNRATVNRPVSLILGVRDENCIVIGSNLDVSVGRTPGIRFFPPAVDTAKETVYKINGFDELEEHIRNASDSLRFLKVDSSESPAVEALGEMDGLALFCQCEANGQEELFLVSTKEKLEDKSKEKKSKEKKSKETRHWKTTEDAGINSGQIIIDRTRYVVRLDVTPDVRFIGAYVSPDVTFATLEGRAMKAFGVWLRLREGLTDQVENMIANAHDKIIMLFHKPQDISDVSMQQPRINGCNYFEVTADLTPWEKSDVFSLREELYERTIAERMAFVPVDCVSSFVRFILQDAKENFPIEVGSLRPTWKVILLSKVLEIDQVRRTNFELFEDAVKDLMKVNDRVSLSVVDVVSFRHLLLPRRRVRSSSFESPNIEWGRCAVWMLGNYAEVSSRRDKFETMSIVSGKFPIVPTSKCTELLDTIIALMRQERKCVVGVLGPEKSGKSATLSFAYNEILRHLGSDDLSVILPSLSTDRGNTFSECERKLREGHRVILFVDGEAKGVYGWYNQFERFRKLILVVGVLLDLGGRPDQIDCLDVKIILNLKWSTNDLGLMQQRLMVIPNSVEPGVDNEAVGSAMKFILDSKIKEEFFFVLLLAATRGNFEPASVLVVEDMKRARERGIEDDVTLCAFLTLNHLDCLLNDKMKAQQVVGINIVTRQRRRDEERIKVCHPELARLCFGTMFSKSNSLFPAVDTLIPYVDRHIVKGYVGQTLRFRVEEAQKVVRSIFVCPKAQHEQRHNGVFVSPFVAHVIRGIKKTFGFNQESKTLYVESLLQIDVKVFNNVDKNFQVSKTLRLWVPVSDGSNPDFGLKDLKESLVCATRAYTFASQTNGDVAKALSNLLSTFEAFWKRFTSFTPRKFEIETSKSMKEVEIMYDEACKISSPNHQDGMSRRRADFKSWIAGDSSQPFSVSSVPLPQLSQSYAYWSNAFDEGVVYEEEL